MYSYQKVINLNEVNFISFYHFIVHLIVFYSNRFEFVKEDFVIIRRGNSVTEKCRRWIFFFFFLLIFFPNPYKCHGNQAFPLIRITKDPACEF